MSRPEAPSTRASAAARLREILARGLGHFCALLLGVMVINVSWQVASRYLLTEPSSFTEELARFLLIWLGLFGGAYALARRLHVAIDLAQRRAGRRARRNLERLAQLAVLLFALLVPVAGGLRLVLLTARLDQQSAALGLPLAWVYAALPVAGTLLATIALCDLIAPENAAAAEGGAL